MLQPVELDEVSRRYAAEIASFHRFFAQAGVPLETPQVTHGIAVRIANDRAFHRDLTAHVWALLDERGSRMRSAELLGVIMMAAAGLRGASQTEEADALAVLLFILEARHAFERSADNAKSAETQQGPDTPRAMPAVEPRTEVPNAPTSFPHRGIPESSLGSELVPLARITEAESDRRKLRLRTHIIWIAAGCVVLLLWVGIPLLRGPERTADRNASASPAITTNVPDTNKPAPKSYPSHSADSSPHDLSQRSRSAAVFHATGHLAPSAGEPLSKTQDLTALPVGSNARLPGENATAPRTAGVTSSVPNEQGTFATERARAVGTAEARNPAMVPLRSGTTHPVVSTDALTQRLDSPRLPAYASEDLEADGRRYPRLLRRNGNGGVADLSESGTTLAAELRAPDLSGAAIPSRSVAPQSTVRGVVRSTCVGTMAGNLIYNPTPAYPAGAASAHIQGQVRIQATVDRDGTVNAARVISGPPLLRDAALEAVQHWRYKPYTSGGKAVPTGTLAIMEFDLQ